MGSPAFGPDDGLKRSQYAGGDDGGNGICRIVKTVDVVKRQGNHDDEYDENQSLIHGSLA